MEDGLGYNPRTIIGSEVKGEKMAFTLDSKIGDFLDDPKGIAALAELVQELSTNPLVGVIKGMTLKDLLAFPQARQLGITQDMVKMGLDQVNARLK